MSRLLGDDIWCVKVNGRVFKGDLSKEEAEAIAERHQRGLCKHKDFGDHAEICRDKEIIREVNEMYQKAKHGERQQYNMVYAVDN